MASEIEAVLAVWRTLPDAIVVLDSTGGVLAANPAGERVLGGAGPKRLGEAVAPRGGTTLAEVLAEAAAGEWKGDMAAVAPDAEAGPWEVLVTPLAVDESPARFMAVLREVRERHARDRARQELLSTVLHDVKGPLTVILGYAELLADPEELPSRARLVDTLARIAECGDQIHALVSNYGLLARVETGRLPSDRRPVDLTEILQRVTEQYGVRARRKGVAMTVEIDPLPEVPGDRSQLERVISNLLSNAVKFTPKDGTIGVRVAVEGDAVTVVVQDDGPGIAADDLDRVFAKFARGPAARRGEGVGLGLAVSRAIARAHGGDVVVTSSPGAGTMFTLSLPLRLPARG